MVETIYNIPNAPRLALLADLHGRPFDDVIRSLGIHKPKIICIAGDIVYGSHPVDDRSPLDTQENVLPFLEACAAIAPTFLSLGNHEWMLDSTDLDLLATTGVTVLDNSWVNHDGLLIAGLTSGYITDYRRFVASLDERERAGIRYPRKESADGLEQRREANKHAPDTSWLSGFCSDSPGSVHILLSHHPEIWPQIKQYPFDLCLSAHCHGGQIRVFGHGVWAPGQNFWPQYTKGVYENRLVVSAGLSNTTWIPRIMNPTEVVYLEP